MTFIINQNGVVYEMDLGKKTGNLARTMNEYNPTSGWRKAEDLPGGDQGWTAGSPSCWR